MSIQALKEKFGLLSTTNQSFKPHPLAQLTIHEVDAARQVTVKARPGYLLLFRDIFAEEPVKAELVRFLEAEHSGSLVKETARPPRLARVHYDTISDNGYHAYNESIIDVNTSKRSATESSIKTFNLL